MKISSPRARFLGVDLDNTLISYDELFHKAAVDEHLIDPSVPKSKELVRDAIRLSPGGEQRWTRLQAVVYGLRMHDAKLFQGADACLRRCVDAGIPVRIVSHKTESATLDGTEINIRQPALQWMRTNGFFSQQGLGIMEEHVFFESTRAQKIRRINELGCTHFIDDLIEVFAEPSFPSAAEKLLFAPHAGTPAPQGVRAFKSWPEIARFLFP